ncbi:mycofactocin biosynthesis glycosyltransferase MftF, partial [Thermodesulfobacteriota bacterium]
MDDGGINRADDPGQSLKPLAYRIRKAVAFHEVKDSCALLLKFPLKVMMLNPVWRPVFKLLSTGRFVSFERIVSLVHHADPEKMEMFLDGLIRKGYLEREGFLEVRDYPTVSVIIPVRNRPCDIKACLQSLMELDYPPEKREIIVVDDASTDDTPVVVSTFPVRSIFLKEHKQASFCRNLGAKRATGDLVAFIDSDCLSDPLWLKELTPLFKDPSVGAVGGMVDAYFNKKGLDRYEKTHSSLNMGPRYRRSSEKDRFFYTPSCNLLVRRDLFLDLGGFKDDLVVGEDVDFCWRMQDAGHHVEYRPIGRVRHKHRNRVGAFCLRRFDYGTSEPMLQKLHPDRSKEMVFPAGESLFWYAMLLCVLLKSFLLLGLGGLVVSADVLNRFAGMNNKGVPIGLHQVVLAVLRSYATFFFSLSAFVSRYHLIWGFFCIPLLPFVSQVILSLHLLTGSVNYFIKKPSLNPVLYFYYFSLEQLSYQSGVWW